MTDIGGNAGKGDTYRPVDSRQYAKNYEAIFKEKKMKIWVATYGNLDRNNEAKLTQTVFKSPKEAKEWLWRKWLADFDTDYDQNETYTLADQRRMFREHCHECSLTTHIKMHTL